MRTLLTVALATLVLAGCTTATNIRQTDRTTTERDNVAQSALDAMRSGAGRIEPGGIRILEDETYVAAKPRVLDRHQTLPTPCNITYAPASSTSLLEFGQTVTKVCGLQVRVTPDALAATSDRGGGSYTPSSAPIDPSTSGIPLPPGVSLPAPVNGGLSTASFNSVPQLSPNRIDIRYSGDLPGLMNAVTARLGLSWRYRDGVITVFHLDTRFFKIYSIPTATTMDSLVASGTTAAAGISGGGGSGGSSSGGISGNSSSAQTTNVSLRTNSSADLIATIQGMITPSLGRMSYSGSSGTLTVIDTPEVLDRVGDYVTDLNTFATKQVLLNVKVLTVRVDDNDEIGINWNLIYTSLADQYGIGLVNSMAASDDAVTGSINILEGNSRFSGSKLIVSALSKQGRVSVLTQPSVTTLNLEPVPVQVAKQTSYLAQSQTTLTADVGSTTSLTPGTVTTGFNMNLLPYILPDNSTILLQFAVNLSSLDSIRRVESGDSAIEIPEVDNRIFSQKVRIKSGETLVLSGFEQSTKSTGRSGLGNPRFWLFGGGANAATGREVLVVLITPVVTL